MTIYDAIQTAIQQLEGVVLPIRDADNSNRVRTALVILDALKATVEENTKQADAGKADDDTEKEDDVQ